MLRRFSAAAHIYCLLTLTACNGGLESEARPPSRQDQVTRPLVAADFCDMYARQVCDVDRACSCELEDGDGCLAQNLSACRAALITHDVMIAIENERMTFDSDRAQATLNTMAASSEHCPAPLDAIGWRRRDLMDFGGMFVGHVPPGEKCSIPFVGLGPNECDGGVCEPVEGSLVCVPVVSVGAGCTGPKYARCLEGDAAIAGEAGRPSLIFSPCVDGVCQARRDVDEPCEADAWCQSLRCREVVVPTTVVEVHLELDAKAAEVHGRFDGADPESYTNRVSVEVVDAQGFRHDVNLYVFHASALEWGYVAMIEQEVVALGALGFNQAGGLEVDYAISGGVSFEASSRFGPITFDFGPSIQEGGSGEEGTRLVADVFAVRRLVGNQRVSAPICASRLAVGAVCHGDADCASSVCRGGVCLDRTGPDVSAWCR